MCSHGARRAERAPGISRPSVGLEGSQPHLPAPSRESVPAALRFLILFCFLENKVGSHRTGKGVSERESSPTLSEIIGPTPCSSNQLGQAGGLTAP